MSQSQAPLAADRQVLEVEARIREQKAKLQRMIAQGTIGQADDDLLRQMYINLQQMQAAARLRGAIT